MQRFHKPGIQRFSGSSGGKCAAPSPQQSEILGQKPVGGHHPGSIESLLVFSSFPFPDGPLNSLIGNRTVQLQAKVVIGIELLQRLQRCGEVQQLLGQIDGIASLPAAEAMKAPVSVIEG